MSRLRISAISFLNTAPLMWDFEHGNAGSAFDISYTVPSRCAAQLAEGSADIGIIPAAAYATVPGLVILPGVAIAARRAVRSILLISKLPLERIQTVALDTSSLTSVALTKVLFAKRWGGGRSFVAMAPNIEEMLRNCDAGMVIGDPALGIDRSRYFTYDLAEQWANLTGKPFVFAFWAVRLGALNEVALDRATEYADLAQIFQRSRDHGLQPQNVETIARQWAPRLEISEAVARAYLTQNIHYYLDPPCLEGLHLFYRYATEIAALPRPPELIFLQTEKSAT